MPTTPTQQPKRAPCQAGCIAGADPRGWVTMIAQHERYGLTVEEAYTKAWQTVVDVNPFPAVLGRICPHPCEAGCSRSDKDGSVQINKLERFIGDWGIEQQLPLERLQSRSQPESIGVVGSGPAGLSFAYQMARRGYHVTVYEGAESPGGMLRHGVPAYRLPRTVLDAEIARILDLGVELQLGTRVGHDRSLEGIESTHDVVFLGIGAQRGLRLGVPGERGPGIWVATEYLRRANLGERIDLGHRVAVIGGGNTAIDSARVARRSGASVTLLYRRTRTEMPAGKEEVQEAIVEGVQIEELTGVLRFEREGDRLRALVAQAMRLGDPDESGRCSPHPIAGAIREVGTDAVIVAVSQTPDWEDLGACRPAGDFVEADDGLLAAGDVTGLGAAGSAIGRARLAAQNLHARLRGHRIRPESVADLPGVTTVKPEYYPANPPAETTSLPAALRLEEGEAEVHQGLTESQALNEVNRCMSCGQCFGCEHCWMFCAHDCFSPVGETRPRGYFELTIDQCHNCGKCVDVCPCGFLTFGPESADNAIEPPST
ncbi:MAG: FAD-dependent oxidoreductase [Acidobacteriota bacterium]|nr:FAD-dependent oxidoreductase [Acidobacteriota bacterium]MDH3785201.1 FAD-dependent oxidoreductase [Acidobacteriota bacterium]